MKKKAMVIASAFLGLLTLAALPQPASAAKKKGTIKVTSMTTVTDKKGNSLEKYRGKSANLLFDEKAKTVNYYGIRYVKSGKSVRAFYDIGHGGYVPADSAILINGKPAIALNSNSYVYNSKLKRTGKKYKVYQSLIYARKVKYSKKAGKKDKWSYYSGNTKKPHAIPKVYKKKYLKIGKNRYIKVKCPTIVRHRHLTIVGYFMTKYSSELKVQIVSDYLNGRNSCNGLSKKYNIAASIIRAWVKAAELNGLESLKVKRTKREYSVDFKLDVVSYYLKSDEGRDLVAAKFNISPSQVYSWTKKFQQDGPEALLPVKKGRPAKMPKKTEKAAKAKHNKQIGTLTDKQKYEAKLLEKDARIKELELELIIAKKSGRPVSTLSNRQKTQIACDIRADHPEFQLKQLFKALNLNRKTYYDNLKRIAKKDKYAEVKELIKDIYYNEGQGTYGYRPMWAALRDKGVKLAMETVRKLMRSIGLKTELYHKRTAKYSSYKGTVGKVADNLLQQHFDEERPYHVLHTDITEYALTNGKKVYISPVVDEASLEILACTASYSPDMELVLGMLDELETKLPAYSHPVIHSDQGSQYQSPTYQARLEEMELVQSMSRKGNCHDNAPGETIFNLMKRERLNRVKLHSLEEVQQELEDYIYWFNNIRRSNKLNYTTPVKYRDRVMATI